MALSQIDPVSALVVIDLQKGIMAIPTAQPAAEVAARAAQLAKAFRAKGQPVILVNVDAMAPGRTETPFNFTPPEGWTDLIHELDRQPTDYVVTKHTVGAFQNTALQEILAGRGVTQVVMCGISTTAGVESTARQAYDRGYNVVLVTDAMTDRDEANHRHSVEKVFPRIGETATTAEVIAKLG